MGEPEPELEAPCGHLCQGAGVQRGSRTRCYPLNNGQDMVVLRSSWSSRPRHQHHLEAPGDISVDFEWPQKQDNKEHTQGQEQEQGHQHLYRLPCPSPRAAK